MSFLLSISQSLLSPGPPSHSVAIRFNIHYTHIMRTIELSTVTILVAIGGILQGILAVFAMVVAPVYGEIRIELGALLIPAGYGILHGSETWRRVARCVHAVTVVLVIAFSPLLFSSLGAYAGGRLNLLRAAPLAAALSFASFLFSIFAFFALSPKIFQHRPAAMRSDS